MPGNREEVRYVAVIELKRVTDVPAQMNARGYPDGGIPAHRKVETFRVPALRAGDLDNLRVKANQYLALVTDEDFGEELKTTRGHSE